METIEIISIIVSLIMGFGFTWIGYILKSAKVAKEIGDLLSVAGAALEDSKVSKDEIAAIMKEYNDVKAVIAAFKAK